MADSKPVQTPLDNNVKLLKLIEDDDTFPKGEYQALVGSLMYAAIGSRPDIAYATQTLSQFSSNPGPAHWTAAKRVLQYLQGTQNLGITYGGGEELIKATAYSDADWASDPNDRRSISGYIFLIGDGPVSWSSKKQPTVALSSMEAKYMAISHAARHAIWTRTLLAKLGFDQEDATEINVDNKSAIDFAKNPMFQARSKHIHVRHHFICERITSNEVTVPYCPTEDNLADIFTKGLPNPQHWKLTTGMGMAAELRGSVGM